VKEKIVLILFYLTLYKNTMFFITGHLKQNKYIVESAIYWLFKKETSWDPIG
jgi:hypothetical protein